MITTNPENTHINDLLKRQDFFKSNDKYKVGVIVLTYNQKEFIREAMDSILMQKVDFPYKIYVVDDCSTDGTSEIIQEYANKYDFIQVKRFEKNLGVNEYYSPFTRMYSKQTIDTEYVALLDGDDYWVDENKLQGQYDFLEEHKECVAVFDSSYLNSTDNPWVLHDRLKFFPITDFSSNSQASTSFYRNIIDFSLHPYRLVEDSGLPIICLVYGKLGYRAEITSLYRQLPQGVYTSLSQEDKDAGGELGTIIQLGFCIQNDVNPRYIKKYLDDDVTLRLALIARLQDKERIEKLSDDPRNISCIDTFKQAIKERGYI